MQNIKPAPSKQQEPASDMSDHQINFLGWGLFLVSAVGFCIASIGHFWAMFGSVFFLVACLVFMIPYFRSPS
ncbi:cytochrome oxidase subunit III [Roseovarius aquimarinus]